jgi:Secretion system C-terminal sorting domain
MLQQETQPGILRAFDATDLSNELWNSQIMASRDSIGNFAKFVNPTIANGKVYLATFSDELAVYGLLQDQRLGNIDHMNFDVSVSPNPAKDVINFKVSDPQINLSRIEIIDEYGKVILNNSAVTNQQIDVNQFLPGTYFIKFYSERGLVAKKVSIVK